MLDLATGFVPKQSVAPQAIATNTTTNGSGVDRHDEHAQAAAAEVEVGSYTDGDFDFHLEHADDDGSGSPGSWANVPADQLIGSFTTLSGAGIQRVGYKGAKRHLRVVCVSTSVSSGATVRGSIVLGALRYAGSGPGASL